MNRARNNTQNNLNNNMNGRIGGVTDNGMNGTNGRTGTNGRNANGGVLTGTLAEQIRALCFVKTELELYLDTHPRCLTALDYYRQTIDELKRLTQMYENTVGPLTAQGNVSTEQWNWVDGPWPWQQAGDFVREEDNG